MKWPNVKLIFRRELRDQLRDRRTLFTVAVLPMLLYPLMGMAMMQVAQFMRVVPTRIWVVGAEHLPESPALIVEEQINLELTNAHEQSLIQLSVSSKSDAEWQTIIRQYRDQSQMKQASGLVDQLIQSELQARSCDVAVFVSPPTVGTKHGTEPLDVGMNPKADSQPTSDSTPDDPSLGVPHVYVFQNSASDKSRIGAERINKILNAWRVANVKQTLSQNGVPIEWVQGLHVAQVDVADKVEKQAAAWSKILPFIIMIWALTGAFYPAIDLCAGEKERGTFETLLSSPAERSEIAVGKLLTVMTFSMATSLLNLLSMGFTGMFVAARLGGGMGGLPMGPPPMASIGWLVLALIPISALFSAVALAAAAFARSSKEGQYYLVPLMMISMPLMMVPMLPAAQLDLGTSLIPISGLMLLLRGLIEGQYAECLKYAAPVGMVTLTCCWVAIRWVIHQFNSETVLFRPSERFGIGIWVRHVMRERHELPSIGSAVLCAVVILVAKFFIGFMVQAPGSFGEFAKQTVIILVATVAVPAIMMALVLTRNPRRSLRLNSCTVPMACGAVLLAICLNPLFTWFTGFVMYVYPPGGDLMALEQTVSNIMTSAPGLWAILLVFALAPALIEEIAFRGFILSGMESIRNKWQAILLTSLMFGIAHGVIQQSVITFGVGMILGVIAVQTRSIIPCILFHLTHNSIVVLLSYAKTPVVEQSVVLNRLLFTADGQTYQYALLPGILMAMVGAMLIVWFLRLNSKESEKGIDFANIHHGLSSKLGFARRATAD